MKTPDMTPLLTLQDISIRFGFVEALKCVNLTIERQEVVSLVGDNGAGKSTLVKIIGGFQQPDSGRIIYDGQEITIPSIREADAMGISSVFQGQEFCDNLNVAANIFLGKEIHGNHGIRDDESMNTKAKQVLKSFATSIRIGQPIGTLSVGQRQTVALARTMLNDPQLILLDEPTASLSVMQTAEVLTYIKRLRSEGRSVVMVNHDLPDVFAVSDRIIVLRHGRVSGIHRTVDTSYEQIIAEIAGVSTNEDEIETISQSQQYGSMLKRRRLIDRTMNMPQAQSLEE